MELNRAQLLVYDDRALEKFWATHGILANVMIKHPRPNDIPHVGAEKPNHIPVHTWLIHQAGLQFLNSPMLKEVMARCRLTFMQVSVNFVRTVLAVDTLMNILDKPFSASNLFHIYILVQSKKEPSNPFYSGNHYLRLRDPSQSQTRNSNLGITAFGRSQGTTKVYPTMKFNNKFKVRSDACKEVIRAANNKQEFRDVEAFLGRAPQREVFSPEVSKREEGYAVSSSGFNSLDHISDGNEEEEAIGQLVLNRRRGRVVPMLDLEGTSSPISILSSDSERSDDLAHALRLSTCGTEVAGTSYNEADIMRFKNLGGLHRVLPLPPKQFSYCPGPPTNYCSISRGGCGGNMGQSKLARCLWEKPSKGDGDLGPNGGVFGRAEKGQKEDPSIALGIEVANPEEEVGKTSFDASQSAKRHLQEHAPSIHVFGMAVSLLTFNGLMINLMRNAFKARHVSPCEMVYVGHRAKSFVQVHFLWPPERLTCDALPTNTRMVRTAARAISGKWLSDGQVRRSEVLERESLLSGWLTQPCLCGVAVSLPSIANVSVLVWGLSKGTLSCKSSSVHYHPLGLSPAVAPRPSFQHSYYSEFAKKQRLGCNNGLSSGRHSSVVLVETSVLTRPMLNGVRTKLWDRRPPSSLCSSSSSGVPTLAKSGYLIRSVAQKAFHYKIHYKIRSQTKIVFSQHLQHYTYTYAYYTRAMDPETALGLVKHGATLLLLDVPQYTLVGIDTQMFSVGPAFKGIKMIPPGPHFVYYSSSNRATGMEELNIDRALYTSDSELL
ncbi:AAR2 protein family [Actinidia rufa]|uniref:AAR2 protein family n=1 Tax=Actinidia rufa TaxID=165716 RepID=A0A7J0EK32_9ERIC|nr:AAR2 protein family [Actinidia rufa]